jgi:hypothetical protein
MTLPLVYQQKATIDNHNSLYSISVQFCYLLSLHCQVLFVIHELCINTTMNMMAEKELQGRKGINQDAMVVWEEFGLNKGTVFTPLQLIRVYAI